MRGASAPGGWWCLIPSPLPRPFLTMAEMGVPAWHVCVCVCTAWQRDWVGSKLAHVPEVWTWPSCISDTWDPGERVIGGVPWGSRAHVTCTGISRPPSCAGERGARGCGRGLAPLSLGGGVVNICCWGRSAVRAEAALGGFLRGEPALREGEGHRVKGLGEEKNRGGFPCGPVFFDRA